MKAEYAPSCQRQKHCLVYRQLFGIKQFLRELFVIFEESADIYIATGLDLDSIAAAVVGGGVYNVANLLH